MFILVCQGATQNSAESQKTAELLLDQKVNGILCSPQVAAVDTATTICEVQEAADCVSRCVEMKKLPELEIDDAFQTKHKVRPFPLSMVYDKNHSSFKIMCALKIRICIMEIFFFLNASERIAAIYIKKRDCYTKKSTKKPKERHKGRRLSSKRRRKQLKRQPSPFKTVKIRRNLLDH